MIHHPIKKLVQAGVHEIMVVTGTEHAGGVYQLLGSGKEYGCEFSYRVQDEAGGIAQALYLAKNFTGNESVCVVLGDNVFEAPLRPLRAKFEAMPQPTKAMVVLCRVDDPERYGVAILDETGSIVRLVEKPKPPSPSPFAVTGVYFYQGAETFDIIRSLRPSGRNELEITDLNNEFLRRKALGHVVIEGAWTDAGTFASLREANELAWAKGGSL